MQEFLKNFLKMIEEQHLVVPMYYWEYAQKHVHTAALLFQIPCTLWCKCLS